jgi:hypothetical protein
MKVIDTRLLRCRDTRPANLLAGFVCLPDPDQELLVSSQDRGLLWVPDLHRSLPLAVFFASHGLLFARNLPAWVADRRPRTRSVAALDPSVRAGLQDAGLRLE